MPSVSDAVVRVKKTGQVLRADCFGNNAAVECPRCFSYPILLIALRDQRGSHAGNPSECRHCGCKVFITDNLETKNLSVLNLEIVEEAK
jgi:hypothetical protein